MKTIQHTSLLAIVMGIGLLLASPMTAIAQEHEHGPKKAEEQGDTSDKQAMRQQMKQQMRACMTQKHEGKGGQHGMMQGEGDMSREQMREQMMAQMEGCMDRMGHGDGMMGGGMMGDGDSPKHDHEKGGKKKPRHDHGKTK